MDHLIILVSQALPIRNYVCMKCTCKNNIVDSLTKHRDFTDSFLKLLGFLYKQLGLICSAGR